MAGDNMAEMAGTPAIATLVHHRIETAGRQSGKLLKGFQDERQVGINLRGTWPSGRRQTSLGENSDNDAAVDAKLGGDGADQPLLDMIVTEYLSFELTGGDHQEMLLAD